MTAVAERSANGITLHPGEHLVYMLVDLDSAMPVGGPYTNIEHSRDAWHWLAEPGLNLSHLQLVVRDREDLVEQVRTWSATYRQKRARAAQQRAQARELSRPCRGCG